MLLAQETHAVTDEAAPWLVTVGVVGFVAVGVSLLLLVVGGIMQLRRTAPGTATKIVVAGAVTLFVGLALGTFFTLFPRV